MFSVIKLLFFSVLLLIFAGSVLSGLGVPPGPALGLGLAAVVGVWGFGIHRAIEHGKQIERLRVAAERARQEAEEAQVIADQEYAAWQEVHLARVRMETRAAMRGFINPN